jgi:hypothetical protein
VAGEALSKRGAGARRRILQHIPASFPPPQVILGCISKELEMDAFTARVRQLAHCFQKDNILHWEMRGAALTSRGCTNAISGGEK